jgi:hypothetical protein
MSGFGDALRSLTSRHKPSFDRITELREAGLTAEEAIEAVQEEEQLRERQQKEATMARGTGVTGRKPDLSSLNKPEPAIGIHDGKPYTERDLERATAADGLGTSGRPDTDVVFHNEQTSPTLKRWKAEEEARQKAREEHEREVLAEARRRLDQEADDAKRESEVQRAMERIRSGQLREPGR